MSGRYGFGVLLVLLVGLLIGSSTLARAQVIAAPLTTRYIDPTGGVSLEDAVSRALENEPSLRAIRSDIDVAKGARLQSALRPNPSVSFEQREEPGGTDSLTTVAVMWPLDLFRRAGRIAVADREVLAARLAASDRERLLAAAVRTQYGLVLANVREAAIFDEVITTMQRQHELLRARVVEGASPPLDRDVLDVELRRLRADQVVRVGRVDAAMVSLKRLLGMRTDASLTLRDTLEMIVHRESSEPPGGVKTARPLGERRADVRQAAVRVDLAEAKIDRAQRDSRFDVSLYASYMRMDSGFDQRGFGPAGDLERVRGQFKYVSAGATVTVPLLNRNQGEIASAKAERASAAAALDASRLNAEAETAAATLQYDRAHEALRFFGDGEGGTRTLARQNLTVVGQSYELGRVTVFDVLAEQRRYLDVERAYTDALRAAYESRTALNLALGDVK